MPIDFDLLCAALLKRRSAGETYQQLADTFGPPITRAHVWKILNRGWEPISPELRHALGLPVLVLTEPCWCGAVHLRKHRRPPPEWVGRGADFLASRERMPGAIPRRAAEPREE